jgi:hypothetical protein
MSFANKIEYRFDILYEKYKNDIKFMNDLIELKKLLIDDYNIVNLDKSEENYIADAIKVKHFKITDDGIISVC